MDIWQLHCPLTTPWWIQAEESSSQVSADAGQKEEFVSKYYSMKKKTHQNTIGWVQAKWVWAEIGREVVTVGAG